MTPEHLRDRCIEAAERAQDDWWEHGKADERTAYVVNAVLAEVAAWCDEQTSPAELDVWVPLHDGEDRELSVGRLIGWTDAFKRAAAQCRSLDGEG